MLTFQEFLSEAAMAVASLNLQSINYHEADETLTVYFRSGGVYRYDDVPADVVDELKFAESRGRYFWRYIRLSYPYTMLRPARKGFHSATNIGPRSRPQRHQLKVTAKAPWRG